MNKKIIEFNDVNYGYDEHELQIKNMSFVVNKNERVGIIGANGAGKSTILKLLLGLMNPNSGKIKYNNEILSGKNLKKVRKKIGYAFQDPDNQLFMPTVYQDITFTAKQEKKSEVECEKLANKILNDIDIVHLRDKASYKLSGGEKRLASLAVALANNPELLVLDEPTVGLDPKSRRQLIDLLKQRDETFLITTHDMDMAYEVCDRILIFLDGELKADDSKFNIFNNEELLISSNLEMPLQLKYGKENLS